jgi:23S rRNA pseudouridine1911/1915/1917 synthase
VRGKPSDQAEIRSFILKDEAKNQVTVLHGEKSSSSERAKEAVLEYRKLGEAQRAGEGAVKTLSLLEVHLHTGRSHQIRAQLADAGFPILGDRKYGPDDGYFRGDICLESYMLSFFHPVSGERMCFTLPLSANDPWNLFQEE